MKKAKQLLKKISLDVLPIILIGLITSLTIFYFLNPQIKFIIYENYGNLSLARDLVRIQNKTNIIENGEVLIYSPIKFETIGIANLLPEVSNIINDDLVKAILRLRLQMISINNELEHYLRLDEERKKFQYEVHSEYVINNV